jgi:hypothetical protein
MPAVGAYRITFWFIVSVVIGRDMAAKPALAGAGAGLTGQNRRG